MITDAPGHFKCSHNFCIINIYITQVLKLFPGLIRQLSKISGKSIKNNRNCRKVFFEASTPWYFIFIVSVWTIPCQSRLLFRVYVSNILLDNNVAHFERYRIFRWQAKFVQESLCSYIIREEQKQNKSNLCF